MQTKGIILAGGEGTRLYPITKVVSKQLLPIHDKPLIYYPLSIFLLLGIKDILFIVKEEDRPLYQELLGNGSRLGLNFHYKIQEEPKGLPDAFLVGEDFIQSDPVTLILGDNLFYGSGIRSFFKDHIHSNKGACAFSYNVVDPERFGVVNYSDNGKTIASLEEKPQNPTSHWAVAGLYHFQNDVIEKAKSLKPSQRGELEIMDLLRLYHIENRLDIHRMPRGFAWLDTGTSEAMMKASQYVRILEERQGLKVACLEEIAYNMGYITSDQLLAIADSIGQSSYAQYLRQIMDREREFS